MADWDTPDALPTGIAPTIAFVCALIGAWLGMIPTIPQVNYNILGQGIVGNHIGVDFGFILAICTALVVRALLDVVLPAPARQARSESAA